MCSIVCWQNMDSSFGTIVLHDWHLFNNGYISTTLWRLRLTNVRLRLIKNTGNKRRNGVDKYIEKIPVRTLIFHCLHLDIYEGRKEMFLFNDTLNTFHLRLYGVGHMVKDHSDRERENPLPPHGILFPISSKGSFICTIPDRITHTTAFVTPVVEHWLEREIAQWVHPMKDQSGDPSHHERTLLPQR